MSTKADIVWNIAIKLGVEAPKMSTGSTEPREIFEIVNETLGLGIDGRLTKPDMARQIVEAAGMTVERSLRVQRRHSHEGRPRGSARGRQRTSLRDGRLAGRARGRPVTAVRRRTITSRLESQ